jgi:hypothetical protein
VTLLLNGTGARLLASRHTLPAKLALTQTGRTVATRPIIFKPAKPAKRKR